MYDLPGYRLPGKQKHITITFMLGLTLTVPGKEKHITITIYIGSFPGKIIFEVVKDSIFLGDQDLKLN